MSGLRRGLRFETSGMSDGTLGAMCNNVLSWVGLNGEEREREEDDHVICCNGKEKLADEFGVCGRA